jgi:hypothetical protein
MAYSYFRIQLTVKSVTTPFTGLVFIETDYTLVANRKSSAAQSRIRILDTHRTDVHAPGHVRGHNVTASLVEYGLLHAWIRGAERLPIPKHCISRGHEAIAHQT